MSITNEIREYLSERGIRAYGFADLSCLSPVIREKFDYGIVMGLTYSKEAIENNKNGNPAQYYDEFTAINKALPELATGVAKLLTEKGYKAWAKVQSTVVQDEDFRTVLPHKTVATLSGLGWIGKNALLVTEEFGSALRLVVVLTNAPLECGTPVKESKCSANCMTCMDICPGHAPLGGLWSQSIDRDSFFNAHACRDAARARAKELLGINETVCGLCIANCPFTKAALGFT